MTHQISLCFLFVFVIFNIYSQTPTAQDCPGAIPICRFSYDEPDPYAYSGNGNYLDEIPRFKDCITIESNGIWYIFNAQTTGNLRFTITPHNQYDDYDWIVFDFSSGDCEKLKANIEKYVVSSNNFGSHIENGPTGANSNISGGEAGNCNGPGDSNGPRWNDDILVTAGKTYLLYLSNYSKSEFGYKIDFSESTAKIFDDVGPSLKNITTAVVGTSEIVFEFSEPVECSVVSAGDFELKHNDEFIKVVSITGIECAKGAKYSKSFQIETSQKLLPGDYTLVQKNTVSDLCGNISDKNSIDFNIQDIQIKSVKFTNYLCPGIKNGSIDIDAECGTQKLLYSIDGGESYLDNKGRFSNLSVGKYQICVQTESLYSINYSSITLQQWPKINIDTISIKNISPCKDSNNGSIKVVAGSGTQPFKYSIDKGVSLTDDNYFDNLKRGFYEVTIVDAVGCSVKTGQIEIQAPESLEAEVVVDEISCNGKNDARIRFTSPQVDSVWFSINGGRKFFYEQNRFDSLSPGQYYAIIKNRAGCRSDSFEINISEPTKLTIDSVNHKNVMDELIDKGGEITAYASGGMGTITYILDSKAMQTENIFTTVPVGSHFVSVKDENGCAGDKTERIEIEIIYSIAIPKAFTPNNDGINDLWKIRNIELYPDTEVKIYDRWQKMVYYSHNVYEGWDGTYNGNKLPTDSYYYIIDLRNGEKPLIGYITLIR